MKFKPEIEKKIDEALDSLNGIQKAEPRAFFFTRLQQKLQTSKKSIWDKLEQFIATPVVAIAGVLLLIILNISLIITREEPIAGNEQEEQTLTEEYNPDTTSIYEYENGTNNE